MLDLTENLTKLPPNKRQLLELLLREQGVDLARLPISAHRSGTDTFPLSFAQQRLWFLDRLEPGMPFYNMPLMVRLIGELRVDLLERTFSELVRRHEVFRTSFPTVDERPMQMISPPRPVTIEIEDLSGYSADELRQRVRQEAIAPFDLDHGPMYRLRLLRLDEQEHVLLLTMHHIISDGWSMGVMIRELATLYTSYFHGEPSPLPELGIQYADFAVWQRQWLSGTVLEEQLEYWRQQLDGDLPVLALATDKIHSGPQHHQGAVQAVTLDGKLSEQLLELSVREGVTMFMVLLAGWQLLLSRYSGQEDICVGTPIANRNRAETEDLIGFFVNTLVLRTDLSGDPSVRELLARVREVCLGAYAHQDMPFEKLVEALQPERDLRRTPLFQTMFILQNASTAAVLELPGLQLQSVGSGGEMAEFDLTLSLSESVRGVQGELSYRTELFEAQTMARLARHYEVLLRSLVGNPEQRLSELSLLTEAERQQLLVEWNETAVAYPVGQTIAGLFEAQVERRPHATALVWDEEELSYADLNQRANQLAHYLVKQGVGPESIVALLLPRGPAMVVSHIAVLKAGAAYLPLDVNYPAERLQYVLTDAQVGWVLTDKELAAQVQATGAVVICVDEVEGWRNASTANLARMVHPEQIAYVIYTSGSTGYPKGVLISHGSLYNYTLMAIDTYGVESDDRVLQFASFGFDASVEEIFPTFCTGATLCLRTEEMLGPATDFLEHCGRLRVSGLILPTAFWHELAIEMQRERLEMPDCVRYVTIGGERALTERALQWREAVGTSVRVFNTYGPTEATVVATLHEINFEAIDRSLPLPIGRPLANTQTLVLDGNGNPCPIGVPGELYLGGAGLARGYLRRPELTAERFIPHPYSEEPGARLYRTGDRARYLADGQLEYLGRLDEQVKVRGYRIELGEIEAVLRRYPDVSECVVLAVERTAGEPQLLAYVVSEAGGPAEWRRYLQQQLPEYMVPAQYVRLAELPLTANGKLDRRALTRLNPLGETHCEREYVAARDLIEQKLVQVWEEVLKLKPIGVKDNFFDLGGHSLLAVNLMSQIRSSLGQKLPLSSLFQGRTIESLAQLLRTGELPTSLHPALVEIQPKGSEPPLFCVHAVGGTVFSYTGLAHHLEPRRPLYGLQAKGLDGKHQPYTCIEEMAAYYIDAIRSVQPDGPYLLAGWSMGGIVALEMARQLGEHGQDVARLVLIDTEADHGNDAQTVIPNYLLLTGFLNNAGIQTNTPVLNTETLQQLTPNEQLAYILDLARANAVLPPDTTLADIQHLFEVYKANLSADRSYVTPPVPCPVTLLKATEQPERRRNEVIDQWRALASAGIDIQLIPGNHFSILREPNVECLADSVEKSLADVQENRFVSAAD